MKTHRFDSVSFIAGLLITMIGLAFLIPADPGDVFEIVGNIGSWFWPIVFIAIGVAVLAPLATRRGDQSSEGDSEA